MRKRWNQIFYSPGFCICGEDMKGINIPKLWICICGNLEENDNNEDEFIDTSEGKGVDNIRQRSGITKRE